MREHTSPTLRELIAGYDRFNEWEVDQRRSRLASLSIQDSLRQFLALCEFARSLCPDGVAIERVIEQKQAGWLSLYRRTTKDSPGPWTNS